MKHLIWIIALLTLHGVALAHTLPTPSPQEYGWKHSLVAGLTLTQVSFTDWAQGGENALSYTISADGKSADDELTSSCVNAYKFAFGQARLGNQGLRKSDDVIDISTGTWRRTFFLPLSWSYSIRSSGSMKSSSAAARRSPERSTSMSQQSSACN